MSLLEVLDCDGDDDDDDDDGSDDGGSDNYGDSGGIDSNCGNSSDGVVAIVAMIV